MAEDYSEQARKFIDASLQGRAKKPTKAAYSRAIKLARAAIDELASLAGRIEKSSASTNLRPDLRRRSR